MRYFVPTVVIIVLLAFACKSNVDKVEDWHKGTTDRIGATLPAPYECSRAKNAWQDMDNQRDRLLATAGPYGGSSRQRRQYVVEQLAEIRGILRAWRTLL